LNTVRLLKPWFFQWSLFFAIQIIANRMPTVQEAITSMITVGVSVYPRWWFVEEAWIRRSSVQTANLEDKPI